MATLKDYFQIDFGLLSEQATWGMKDQKGDDLEPVIARTHKDFDSNSKFWSFYIPEGTNVGIYVNTLFQNSEVQNCVLSPEGDTVNVYMGLSGYSERASSESLIFTSRIFLYIDHLLTESERKAITEQGKGQGFHVIVRDREYASTKSSIEKPLAFISHDSRDKEELVRDLARELSGLMCPVWYDEYSLKVGASLRESIEKGLKEARNCIVVLSPNFLSNKGWGKTEFDSIYTREILKAERVMLPVWHNVTAEQVYEYSPKLADTVGLDSADGVKKLATRLANEIRATGT